MSRNVNCVKLGREAPGLDFAPWQGELGRRIFDNVSKEAWTEWLTHQTMLIKENRLQQLDKTTSTFLAAEMENYYFREGAKTQDG